MAAMQKKDDEIAAITARFNAVEDELKTQEAKQLALKDEANEAKNNLALLEGKFTAIVLEKKSVEIKLEAIVTLARKW